MSDLGAAKPPPLPLSENQLRVLLWTNCAATCAAMYALTRFNVFGQDNVLGFFQFIGIWMALPYAAAIFAAVGEKASIVYSSALIIAISFGMAYLAASFMIKEYSGNALPLIFWPLLVSCFSIVVVACVQLLRFLTRGAGGMRRGSDA